MHPDWLLEQVLDLRPGRAPERPLEVAGPSGSGRSHLLRQVLRECRQSHRPVLLVPLGELARPGILSGFGVARQYGRSLLLYLIEYYARQNGLDSSGCDRSPSRRVSLAVRLSRLLTDLMERNHLDRLVVLLDDYDRFFQELQVAPQPLDELQLPAGCSLVLSVERPLWSVAQDDLLSLSGPSYRQGLQAALHAQGFGRRTRKLLEHPDITIGRAWLAERSLRRGLISRVSRPDRVVPLLLKGLQKRHPRAFHEHHAPALARLCLLAARRVSPALLRRLGLSEEGLHMALFDLRDLLDGIDLESPAGLLSPRLLRFAWSDLTHEVQAALESRYLTSARQALLSSRPDAWSEPPSPSHLAQILGLEMGGLGERPPEPCRPMPALIREECELYLDYLLSGLPPPRARQTAALQMWRLGLSIMFEAPVSACWLVGACCERLDPGSEAALRWLDLGAMQANLGWHVPAYTSSLQAWQGLSRVSDPDGATRVSQGRALLNMGAASRAQGQTERAVQLYSQAEQLLEGPDLSRLYVNRSNALWDLDRREESLHWLELALEGLRQEEELDDLGPTLELAYSRNYDVERWEAAAAYAREALIDVAGSRTAYLWMLRLACLPVDPPGRNRLRLRTALRYYRSSGVSDLEPAELEEGAEAAARLGASDLAAGFWELCASRYRDLVASGHGRLRRELGLCLTHQSRLPELPADRRRQLQDEARTLLQPFADPEDDEVVWALTESPDAL